MINFVTIFRHFFYLGCISFGGPAAHLGYFQRYFIAKHQWLDLPTYSRLVALSQFLPGPSSSQVGFSIGYHRGGLLGAIAAFLGFTLPSFVLLYLLAVIGMHYANSTTFIGAIYGLKLLAVVVVADAVMSMSKVFCRQWQTKVIAMITASTMILFGSLTMQLCLLVIAGGLMVLLSIKHKNNEHEQENSSETDKLWLNWPALLFFIFCLVVLPLGFYQHELIALFNSFFQAGSLVFGGGHVVLPLLQQTISQPLADDTFLLGYAAAQAVPGPMFTIATFLGANLFTQTPLLGAAVATIAIFLPGFLLILALQGAWRQFAGNTKVSQFITGVNAAVVGLLAAAFYQPVAINAIYTFLDVAIVLLGYVLLTVFRLPILAVVGYFLAAGIFIAV